MAAWRSTRDFFSSSEISAAIKSIWKGATPLQIPTVIHDPFFAMALGRAVSPRGLPWHQSRNGMALCRRSWLSEEECRGGMAIARADCGGTFHSHRARIGRSCARRRCAAFALRQDSRRLRSSGFWRSPVNTQESSTLGRNANRFSRFVHLVFPDGLRSWRWLHVASHLAENVHAPCFG